MAASSDGLVLHYHVAGPSAWFGGEPGQVGNEAAIAVQSQCRSQARHPLLAFFYGVISPILSYPVSTFPTESGTLFAARFIEADIYLQYA